MEEGKILVRVLALLATIDNSVNNYMVGTVDMFMFTSETLAVTSCGGSVDGIKVDDEMNVLVHFTRYDSKFANLWLNASEVLDEMDYVLDHVEKVLDRAKEIHVIEHSYQETIPSGNKVTLFETSAFLSKRMGYKYAIEFRKTHNGSSFTHYKVTPSGCTEEGFEAEKPKKLTELEMAEAALESVAVKA